MSHIRLSTRQGTVVLAVHMAPTLEYPYGESSCLDQALLVEYIYFFVNNLSILCNIVGKILEIIDRHYFLGALPSNRTDAFFFLSMEHDI